MKQERSVTEIKNLFEARKVQAERRQKKLNVALLPYTVVLTSIILLAYWHRTTTLFILSGTGLALWFISLLVSYRYAHQIQRAQDGKEFFSAVEPYLGD